MTWWRGGIHKDCLRRRRRSKCILLQGWHLFSDSRPSKEPKDGWVHSKRICDRDQLDHGSPNFCDGGIQNAWRSENVQVSPSLLVILDELTHSHMLKVREQAKAR